MISGKNTKTGNKSWQLLVILRKMRGNTTVIGVSTATSNDMQSCFDVFLTLEVINCPLAFAPSMIAFWAPGCPQLCKFRPRKQNIVWRVRSESLSLATFKASTHWLPSFLYTSRSPSGVKGGVSNSLDGIVILMIWAHNCDEPGRSEILVDWQYPALVRAVEGLRGR